MTVRSRDFSVLHVNTRSMMAHNNTMKLDEINVLAAEYNFDVIRLTETWLDNSIDASSKISLLCYVSKLILIWCPALFLPVLSDSSKNFFVCFTSQSKCPNTTF